MNVNREKMKGLIEYILKNFEESLSRDLLIEILFFSDISYYEKYKVSITNETYKKYPNGPVAMHFIELKDELVEEGKIKELNKPVKFGSIVEIFYQSHDLLKINLTGIEKEIVDSVIFKLSELKNNDIGNYCLEKNSLWESTKEYGILEYGTN